MHGIQAWVALPREHEETDAGVRAPRRRRPADVRGRRPVGARRRGRGASARRPAVQTHSPMFYVHWRLAAGRARRAPTRAIPSAPPTSRRARSRSTAATSAPARCSCSRPARRSIVHGDDRRDRDAARRRAGRRALHRVELRVVVEGAHRAGEGRLARRPHEAAGARRPRVHPAAAGPAARGPPVS